MTTKINSKQPQKLLIAVLIVLSLSQTSTADFVIAGEQDVVAMYLFHGRDEATFLNNTKTRLAASLIGLAQVVELQPAQSEKLDLAAQGEVARLRREIKVVRQRTEGLDMQKQKDQQKIWEIIAPLQSKVRDRNFDNSLVDQTIQTILTPDQRMTYNAYLEKRRHAYYLAILKATIVDLELSLPLTQIQRHALLKLCEKQGFPKKVRQSYQESMIGFLIICRLPDSELAQFLDEPQREVLKKYKQLYKSYNGGIEW